jgi:hypothetical protein
MFLLARSPLTRREAVLSERGLLIPATAKHDTELLGVRLIGTQLPGLGGAQHAVTPLRAPAACRRGEGVKGGRRGGQGVGGGKRGCQWRRRAGWVGARVRSAGRRMGRGKGCKGRSRGGWVGETWRKRWRSRVEFGVALREKWLVGVWV